MPAALIGAGTAGALLAAFVLRPRLPAAPTAVVLAAAAAAVGWGAALAQEGAGATEMGLAAGVMAVLGPLHVRAVVGSFGSR